MPELPEIETIVQGLKKRITGKKAINLTITDTKVVDKNIKSIIPFTITNVTRRAKYLIFHTSTPYSLLCHLKMTGHFHYPTTNEEQINSQKYCVATLTFHDHTILTHNSIRRLGFLKKVTPQQLQQHLKPLGPEPLTLTKANFIQILAKYPHSPIKTKIMDQRVIVGIGNIYAQEVLYKSKIHPQTPIKKISSQKLTILHKHIQQTLTNSIKSQGTSVKNYSHLTGKGGYQKFLQIYQKNNCPKGHTTSTLLIGGRGTTFCPTCQK